MCFTHIAIELLLWGWRGGGRGRSLNYKYLYTSIYSLAMALMAAHRSISRAKPISKIWKVGGVGRSRSPTITGELR